MLVVVLGFMFLVASEIIVTVLLQCFVTLVGVDVGFLSLLIVLLLLLLLFLLLLLLLLLDVTLLFLPLLLSHLVPLSRPCHPDHMLFLKISRKCVFALGMSVCLCACVFVCGFIAS